MHSQGKSLISFMPCFAKSLNLCTYKMTGHVSEESNESFNGMLAEIKNHLKSMQGTKQRIGVTNSRTQGHLKGGILEERICLQTKITGKKRVLQKPRQRTIDNGTVLAMECGDVMLNGESYYRLTNGNMLPPKWCDLYDWFAVGMASRKWRDALARTAVLTYTYSDKAREGFSQF